MCACGGDGGGVCGGGGGGGGWWWMLFSIVNQTGHDLVFQLRVQIIKTQNVRPTHKKATKQKSAKNICKFK